MNFADFKDWIEKNKWTSAILIILFVLGVVFQFTDFYEKIKILVTGTTKFEIVSVNVSHKHSVYRDISKVDERMKPYFRPTQFNDENNYRQIVRDATFFDNMGLSKSVEIPYLALIVTAFAIDNDIKMEKTTKDLFERFETDEGIKELISFIFTMIPSQRFVPVMDDRVPYPYVHFWPDNNDATNAFQKALDIIWSSDATKAYRMKKKVVKRSTVDAFLDEYYAAFKLGFFPVFEMTLYNDGTKNIVIDSVGAEVIDIAEYMGGAELIPTSNVINIPIEYKIGDNWKNLTDPIVFKAGDYLRLLIRLEPQEKESSYLITQLSGMD